MTDLMAAWRACHVQRWHRNPDLSGSGDCMGGHQGRVALLALCLFPNAHGLHRAAIMHDLGEAATGDIPATVKAANPDLADALDRIESEAMRAMDLPTVNMDQLDEDRLKLCDRLDAYLWARHRAPHVLAENVWLDARDWIRATGWKLRVGSAVEAVLK